NVIFALDDRTPTLASMLKGAGYRTGAFVGAFVLDARFGLSRGFDEYDDRYTQQPAAASFAFVRRTASDVANAAERWILQRSAPGQPWFAWVHFYDPHAPYAAPVEYRTGRSAYDAAVAYTDAVLGSLLDRLRAAHALDRTLLVVTSDHGESLGEHGETTPGLFAYDAALAVPLIVGGPSIGRGVAGGDVGHADIVPTVLELVQVAPAGPLDGRSLTSPAPDRAVYFEAL